MSDPSKPSLRIDWFDGTVIKQPRPETTSESRNSIEETCDSQLSTQKIFTEKKLMGFKRLLTLSQLETTALILKLSGPSSFWQLLNTDLKGDLIVLIVKILSKLFASYNSGEKSLMLENLVKENLLPYYSKNVLKTGFINTLQQYICSLPETRIVDKQMNMLFWDDVETFFSNVIIICEGLCKLNSQNAHHMATSLVNCVSASIYGLIKEHKEQFSEILLNDIDRVDTKLQIINEEIPVSESSANKDQNVYNFRNLSIFPSREDLLENRIHLLQPNIIDGAYSNGETYLDIQFKLLREDCFGPLHEGICKYIENPSRTRHENIRVHPKVRILRNHVSNNKIGYLVDIAWQERQNCLSIDCKSYTSKKQLMFGSLLLFTSDNFNTVLCGTVLDSNSALLSEGYVAVSLHSPVSSNIFTDVYLMVESEVFFEPYHRVLKVLQQMSGDDIPMGRYIVDVQKTTNAPSYLSRESTYSISVQKTPNNEISFPVLEPNNWPDSKLLGLDDSQAEAFKLALTREFAVIQGPPGTGKTFIGLKVAKTLLSNLSLEGTPMLVICYTNHALDQFLEGILSVTKNVVRLGSQCKNPLIEPYTLKNVRTKFRYSQLFGSKKNEQENVFKQMMYVQGEIEKCEKDLISYKSIKYYLKLNGKFYELYHDSTDDPVVNWLFADLEKKLSNDTEKDDWENTNDEINEPIEICFSEKWAVKEIDSLLNSIKYVNDVTDDPDERQNMIKQFHLQANRVKNQFDYFKKNFRKYQHTNEANVEITNMTNLYDLSAEDKWKVYFNAVAKVKNKLMSDMNILKEKYEKCCQELDEITTLVDTEVVRNARVLGVTTTAAARRRALLQLIKSPIVIVEEAAEVLEAHIVASLTHHCQHVILIGDHKQLRPTAAHYKLARDFNLEISLFERMIRNGIHSRTLTTQRRMRPDFVQLIVPAIYEKLDCHKSVLKYPNIRGMTKNIYFMTHSVNEDEGVEDSWSYRNKFEAEMCIGLALYLRRKNYNSDEITILATYAGQSSLIKKISEKHKLLKGVKITVIDNYQGEENRIVILSLVRSNKDGKIGFVAAQNRICVGLTRAKEGFYMFGNMEILESASRIWKSCADTLKGRNAIGPYLTLRCDSEPDNELIVRTIKDFP